MQPGTHEFARTRFGLNWSTFLFIVLNLATCCYLMIIWSWNFTNRVSGEYARRSNRTLLILFYAFAAWQMAIAPSQADYYTDLEFAVIRLILTLLLSSACLVLVIVLSFRTKSDLERMLAENGMPQRLNGFLCFILPFIYQYYVAWNAEDRFSHAQMVSQAYAQARAAAPYQQNPPYPAGSSPQANTPQPGQPQQYADQQPHAQPAPQGIPRNIPSPPPPPPGGSHLASGVAAAAGAVIAGAATGDTAQAAPAEPTAGGSGLDVNKIASGAKKAYSIFNKLVGDDDEDDEDQVEEDEGDDDDEEDEE